MSINNIPHTSCTGCMACTAICLHEETIYTEFQRLLTDKAAYDAMAKASNPYGDGHACERIVGGLNN